MKPKQITVEEFFEKEKEALSLELVAPNDGLSRLIREPTINRPGLALAGFTRYFASKRIQVIGNAESTFLESLSREERIERCKILLDFKIPCIVFSRDLPIAPWFLELAKEAGVPVLQCPLITMKFINLTTLALEWMFAPKGSVMGSMVDILGVGVIIMGESGIGKSESVLALIERGYSLVADDITKVTLLDGMQVVGTSSELTRNHMEVRGIGIINVAAMFGVKSIRVDKRVDLVVSLKTWENVEDVDRVGMEEECVKILGVNVPHIIIPVRPGRDLARLIEVAAFQTKLKRSGYNPAESLNSQLINQMSKK